MAKRGEMLGENYRVVEVHEGGMGEVFVCEILREDAAAQPKDESLTLVALKTFQKKFFFDNAARLSFEREAATWLRLSGQPHIMPVLGLIHIDNRPFLVMPAVSKGELGERSVADLLERGPLPLGQALQFGFQCALALRSAATHVEELVHGDIKPANILLLGGQAFLTDFGLASAGILGRADSRLEGTWAYLAPELWDGETRSVSSDIYAFGAMFYEMLFGRTPYLPEGGDRDSWARAHRTSSPSPLWDTSDEYPEGVVQLVLSCLEKDPANRPADFGQVFERLTHQWKEHDPVAALQHMMKAAHWIHEIKNERSGLAESRVSGLLELGDTHSALALLDSIDQAQYSDALWFRRGSALSLANRDEEALEAYARVDIEALREEDVANFKAEYALSLKRLKRYEEARAIYDELLATVSDEQLPMVIVNLATVYLEQHKGDDAVRLLEPFVRRSPDVGTAWANLGQAYTLVGRYDDAVSALSRAISLEPNDGIIRVKFAAVQMDHRGRLEDAWAALDAAFDAGHESREWLVRTLACAVLLQKEDAIYALHTGMRSNMEDDLREAILGEAQELIEMLVNRHAGDSEVVVGDGPETDFDGDNDTDSPTTNVPSVGDVETNEELPQEPDEGPPIPFMNFRFYDFQDFTIDYYQYVDFPNYTDAFMKELQRAKRDPRFSPGGEELRGSPFYFSQCPGCSVYILTNRDVGKRLHCRMCGHSAPTDIVRSKKLDRIVASVSDSVGVAPASGETVVYALHVSPPNGDDLDAVGVICRDAGLAELRHDQLLAVFLHREANKRGVSFTDPWSAWMLETKRVDAWSRGSTPKVIRQVVSDLQLELPGVKTLSTDLGEADARTMTQSAAQISDEMDALHRQAIADGTADSATYKALADSQIRSEAFDKAEANARAAVALDDQSAGAWFTLGHALSRRDMFHDAREALERSTSLDPNEPMTWILLALCLEKTGDVDRALEVRARADALGEPRVSLN